MITTGLTSSLSDEWTTPHDLFQDLNSEFAFTLDVASTHENALCEHHFTKCENGLIQTWAGNVFCNPPYGKQIAAWMKKAAETDEGGGSRLLSTGTDRQRLVARLCDPSDRSPLLAWAIEVRGRKTSCPVS